MRTSNSGSQDPSPYRQADWRFHWRHNRLDPMGPFMLRMRSRPMPLGFIEPCLPTVASKPPSGPGWLHEIKHDGFRMMMLRTGGRVRVLTRNGVDWTDRF